MKKKRIILVILLILILFMTIGYAAFSNILKITGQAKVVPDANNYKVLFASSIRSISDYDTNNVEGISLPNNLYSTQGVLNETTFSNASVTFTEDGQSIEYKFYILNAGKYNAHITDIDIGKKTCTPGDNVDTTLAQAACDSIGLSVILGNEESQTTYTSSTAIENHVLPKGTWEPITVRISYPEGSPLPDGNIEVKWQNIKMLTATTKNYIPPKIIKNYEIGEEFCLGSECFYVIENTGEKIKALAKYNLKIGYNCDYGICEEITKDDTYGIQNTKITSTEDQTCVIPFSTSNYWWDYETDKVSSKYEYNNDEKTAFVYDNNSNLYEYLINYEKYLLEQNDTNTLNVSLITYEEYISLMKNYNFNWNETSWLHQSNYWSGSSADTYNENVIYSVCIEEQCNKNGMVPSDYNNNHYWYIGIRPKIIIDKAELSQLLDEE